MGEDRKKKFQRPIGFVFSALAAAVFFYLLNIKELSAINFLIGLAFGITMVRGDFSFSANLRGPVLKNDYRFTYLFWQMTVATCGGYLFIMALENYYGVFNWDKYAAEPTQVSPYFCVSAVIFGFGLAFLGSAGSGIIKKAINGNLGFVLALISYCFGSVCGVVTREFIIQFTIERTLYMPDIFGWPIAIMVQIFFFLLSFYVIQNGIKKFGEYRGEDDEGLLSILAKEEPPALRSRAAFRELFISDIEADRGIVFITLIMIIYFAFNQRVMGLSMPLSLFGYKVMNLIGLDVSSLFSMTGLPGSIKQNWFENQNQMLLLGYAFGVLIVPLLKGKYRFKGIHDRYKLLIVILGGFLVGFGVQGMYGANIGEIYGAIAMFSFSGWLVIPFALLGVFLGKPVYEYLSKKYFEE